jgi:hypothetical protein
MLLKFHNLHVFLYKQVLCLGLIFLLNLSNSMAEQNQEHFQKTITSECFNYLGSNPNLFQDDFDVNQYWASLGLDPNKIRLMFIKEFHFVEDAILFKVQYDGSTLMRMTLIQNENFNNIWHTELSIIMDDKFLGKSLGFVTYLLAATQFYRNYPDSELHGSGNQSDGAKKLWQRLVQTGFAESFDISQTQLAGVSNGARLNQESLGEKLKTFVEPYIIFTPRLD